MDAKTENKTCFHYMKPELCLALILIFSTLLAKHVAAISFYHTGLGVKKGPISLGLLCSDMFSMLFFLIFVITAVARIWIRRNQGMRMSLCRINLLCIVLLALSIIPLSSKPGVFYLVEGLSEEIQKEADIPAIQEWLKTVVIRDGKECCSVEKSDWPKCIAFLKPKYVWLEKDFTGVMYVHLEVIRDCEFVVGPDMGDMPRFYEKRYKIMLTPTAYVYA